MDALAEGISSRLEIVNSDFGFEYLVTVHLIKALSMVNVSCIFFIDLEILVKSMNIEEQENLLQEDISWQIENNFLMKSLNWLFRMI
jgi:hypothetical protein